MLLGVTSDFLTETERADIKEFALQLAAYHQAQIKRQRPQRATRTRCSMGLPISS